MMVKTSIIKIVLFNLFLFISFTGFSQRTQVEGVVTDAKTGDPLPGVSIVEKGTTNGTTTNASGEYSITVSAEAVLEYSFVGYQPKEIDVNGRTKIDIQLQQKVEELEEVVVIGYGQVKQEDATGSLSKISSDDFQRGAITSPQKLLQGKSAGVQVTTSGGAPGSGTQIRIRGASSLTASSDPLIVIDGVPMSTEGVSGMRNPLNSINPADIENITVLKDASATAIYGSRATNGVILIETKTGKEGQEMTVNYQGKVSVNTPTNTVDVLSADEFSSLIQDKFPESDTLLGSANTNWQDEIFRSAISHDHNLSLTGAVNKVPYRASVGYKEEQGILKTSNLDRTTLALKATPTLLDDHLDVRLDLKGVHINNRFADEGAIGSAVSFDPTKPVKDPDSPYGGYYTWTQTSNNNPNTIAPTNPVALLMQRNDESTVNRAIGNIKLDYKLHFLPELQATLKVGYDYSDSEGDNRIGRDASWEYNTRPEVTSGSITEYSQEKKHELLDFYLRYEKDLPSIESNINIMGGYSYEHFWQKDFNKSMSLKPLQDSVTYEIGSGGTKRDTTAATRRDTTSAPDYYKTEHYLVSFFARANYTFKDRYLLTATLRQDGTSRFSEENRWGLFPSLAFAWKMHEESFLQDIDIINQMKLRLGYGVTGQQNITDNDYPYFSQYTYSTPTAQYQLGDQFYRTIRPEDYNKFLKWEETTTYNIGLDYGLFNNRLQGAIEVYYKKTQDLINTVPVAAGTNFTNRIISNVGSLENQGVEFSIIGRPISREDLFWEISANASYNENEITKLTTVDDPDYEGVITGGISGGVGNNIQIHSVGHPLNSFYVFEQVYDENGLPVEGVYVDRNEDGEIDEDDRYRFEDPSPDVSIGLSSRLTYKNWDFSFSARAEFGRYVYNNISSNHTFYEERLGATRFLRNATSDISEVQFQNAEYMSDHYIENGSFFRIDNIELGYSFDNQFGLDSHLRVYTTITNPLLVTKYSGIDPEIPNGIDNNFYPRPTTFLLGVNLEF
jgi:iron complex outermembrane receptor protein